MPSVLEIAGQVSGGLLGIKTIGGTISSTATVNDRKVQTLASATTTAVAVPTGAVGVVIQPPAANGTEIRLDSAAGVRLHATNPTVLSLHSTVTSITMYAGAEIVGVLFDFF